MGVVLALQVGSKGALGGLGVVGLGVEHDEVDHAIIPGVPHVADSTGLVTRHSITVLVRGEVALGRRAAVVVERLGGFSRVELVMVQVVGGQVVSIVGNAARLVVTGSNHVWHLGGDVVHPLLPDIPVSLVEGSGITTPRGASSWLLALRQRFKKIRLNGASAGGSAIGTVVANAARVILAGQQAVVPVIGVRQITTMGKEVNLVVADGLLHKAVGQTSVGVSHVIQNTKGVGGLITSSAGSLERHDVGGSGAVGSLDLVVVGGGRLEAVDGDIVEELVALSYWADLRARGNTAIAIKQH